MRDVGEVVISDRQNGLLPRQEVCALVAAVNPVVLALGCNASSAGTRLVRQRTQRRRIDGAKDDGSRRREAVVGDVSDLGLGQHIPDQHSDEARGPTRPEAGRQHYLRTCWRGDSIGKDRTDGDLGDATDREQRVSGGRDE